MEIGIIQLFWLVIIISIFVASAVKRYLRNKKSNDRLSSENVRKRGKIEKRKPRPQQRRSEWEEFMSDMFGVEPIKIRKERTEEKEQKPARHIEAEQEEQVEPERVEVAESVIEELHPTIEDHHIKSEIEDKVLEPTIQEPQTSATIYETEQEYKSEERREKVSAVSYDILRKDGLKNAIIYSEIIGPPIGLRKRSLLRHKH